MLKIRMWVGTVGLALALVVGGVAGSLVTAKSQGVPFGSGQAVPMYIATDEARGDGHAPLPMTFAPIVKPAMAAVVNVSSSKIVHTPGGRSPYAPG